MTKLTVSVTANGFESVDWKEPDRFRFDEDVGRVVKVHEGRERSIVRRLRGPLSSETIWDRSAGRFKPGWGPNEMPVQPY